MPTVNEYTKLPELVNKILDGNEFLITREGEPVARLLPLAGRLRFPDLSEFRASIPPSKTSAAELVSQMRDEVDEKFG
ncbi:MAG: type II toxin-antitoxin system prevent-host-death family antitoxin [Candidatus Parabeggiatoa sp. nov. 1]|nr:MAG: type II toxin-antitoxin system prevent-host-death family antitoxin [Gammaproteobacteria bacterium]